MYNVVQLGRGTFHARNATRKIGRLDGTQKDLEDLKEGIGKDFRGQLRVERYGQDFSGQEPYSKRVRCSAR